MENLCNTEEMFCKECNLNKTLDICSGEYGKPSPTMPTTPSTIPPPTPPTTPPTTSPTTSPTTPKVEFEKVPKVEPEDDPEEGPKIEPEEDSDDSKEDDTNDASNQLIPHIWFFVSLLSSFPNVINFRWIFNPIQL